jgi:hypothetical protein
MPLIKTFGAELAFDTASRALQVLGGVGYTRAYPVEQALRDSRVFAIYEGTTGMQAQDFLLRQCLPDDAAALASFFSIVRAECRGHAPILKIIERFADLMETVSSVADRDHLAAMAEPVMRAAWVATQAWLASRIEETASARFFMETAPEHLALCIAQAKAASQV